MCPEREGEVGKQGFVSVFFPLSQSWSCLLKAIFPGCLEQEERSSPCPQLPDWTITAAPRAQAAVPLLAFPAPGKGLLWAEVSHKCYPSSPALWHCMHKLSCGLPREVIKWALVHGLFLSTACKPSDPLTTCCSLGF